MTHVPIFWKMGVFATCNYLIRLELQLQCHGIRQRLAGLDPGK